jgi:hypothetical protein
MPTRGVSRFDDGFTWRKPLLLTLLFASRPLARVAFRRQRNSNWCLLPRFVDFLQARQAA